MGGVHLEWQLAALSQPTVFASFAWTFVTSILQHYLDLHTQVDYLLRRLMLLNERVGATESYLSIEMDHRR